MKEQTLGWLARKPFMYDLMRGLLRLYFLREENPAFWIWVSHLLRTYKQAFSHKKPAIWINSFFPTEIIYSMDGVPIHPELLSALMAYFNISNHFLERADTRMSTDLCSFYRVALGMLMMDYLPRPDLLLSSSDLCDGSNKFFGYLSRHYGVPHLFLF